MRRRKRISVINWTEIITALLGIILTGLVIPLAKAGFDYLVNKLKDERLQAAMLEASDMVYAAVGQVNQVFVDQLKAAGEFSPDKAAEAAKMALRITLESLSERAQRTLIENKGNITDYLTTKIEAAVRMQWEDIKPHPPDCDDIGVTD